VEDLIREVQLEVKDLEVSIGTNIPYHFVTFSRPLTKILHYPIFGSLHAIE